MAFANSCNTNASGSTFYDVGGHQYNIFISDQAQLEFTLDTLNNNAHSHGLAIRSSMTSVPQASFDLNSKVPELPKARGHVGCQLDNLKGCCACLDKHPFNEDGYSEHIDGLGWSATASREACKLEKIRPAPSCSAPPSELQAPDAYVPPSGLAIGSSMVVPRASFNTKRRKNRRKAPGSPKACGHVGCQLDNLKGCCACLDERPFNEDGYSEYIDGLGWSATASREAMYCPSCRIEKTPGSRKACGHVGCQLDNIKGCCACLDKRPFSGGGYPEYIDGLGWRATASRKAHYCPSCKIET